MIGQVRFNPVPVPIRDNIEKIQEGFRRLGYTDYRPQTLQQMQIVLENGRVTERPIGPVDIFEFANAERTELFRLEPAQLSLQTVDYQTFAGFSQALAGGLEVLAGNLPLDFIERVGLRFLDAVMPREGEDVADYLHEQLLGLSALADNLTTTFSLSETLMRRGSDSILARVVIQEGRVGFPPDLEGVGMEIGARFRNFSGRLAILDNDAFYTERMRFHGVSTIPSVMETFKRLRNLIDEVFQKSVTEKAFEVWRGED
ncbi:hypothetical protein SY28_05775 [Meiothermus taiwanensis]|nr:hypothetical protein SY28_05775 [Meiothermus taiwanensis]KZK14944.1 hypothetical protein A3962_12095 [Meiothermus taiwanensis]